MLRFQVGDTESEPFWGEFFRDLKRRGLRGVQLVISDAHAGLVRAIEVSFEGAAGQRCRVHFMRNVLGYVDPPIPPRFDSWDAYEASLPAGSRGSAWACQYPEGVGPRLFFQRVPESKTVKNRLHLDVRVGVGLTGAERLATLEAEAGRLEHLGARRLRLLPADEENESCLVMQDLEGNEFCLD